MADRKEDPKEIVREAKERLRRWLEAAPQVHVPDDTQEISKWYDQVKEYVSEWVRMTVAAFDQLQQHKAPLSDNLEVMEEAICCFVQAGQRLHPYTAHLITPAMDCSFAFLAAIAAATEGFPEVQRVAQMSAMLGGLLVWAFSTYKGCAYINRHCAGDQDAWLAMDEVTTAAFSCLGWLTEEGLNGIKQAVERKVKGWMNDER